jgi:hypothetical protein
VTISPSPLFWLRWAWRDLRAHWVGIVAIATVIAIGTGVYAGLSNTSTWRRLSYDASYSTTRLHDLRIATPAVGFGAWTSRRPCASWSDSPDGCLCEHRTMIDEHPSRRLWRAVETVHAVTYFAEESIAAARDCGYKGFWMGYFAFRAAPLGPVGAAPVEALFNTFNAERVQRALPDAWGFAPPHEAIAARRSAAGVALARCGVEALDEYLMQAMYGSVATIAPHGRALFAANRAIPQTGEALGDLWQWCTTVREHRGDSHVAALAVLGIDGLEATVLLAADQGIDVTMFEESRGWEPRHIAAAQQRLGNHRLLDADGRLTDDGRELRSQIEDMTDRQAFGVIARLGQAYEMVLHSLEAAAAVVNAAGIIPYPNPMGLDLPPEA